ncbi:hypothetical protein ACWEVO_23325, partial [Micromonospora sp. NPDC003776]
MSTAELWRPASGCGPWCLPGPAGAPTVSPARRAGRLLGVVGMLLAGVGLAVVLPVLPAGCLGPSRRAR